MTSLIIVIVAFLAFAAYVMGGVMLQLQEQKPIVASDKFADYDFVVRCLRSCDTMDQYESCVKLTELFESKHHDEYLQQSLYDISEDVFMEINRKTFMRKTTKN